MKAPTTYTREKLATLTLPLLGGVARTYACVGKSVGGERLYDVLLCARTVLLVSLVMALIPRSIFVDGSVFGRLEHRSQCCGSRSCTDGAPEGAQLLARRRIGRQTLWDAVQTAATVSAPTPAAAPGAVRAVQLQV